jgi:hypothetical protein
MYSKEELNLSFPEWHLTGKDFPLCKNFFIMGTVYNLIEPSTIYSQNGPVLSRKGTII